MASRNLTVDNTAPTTEDVLGLLFENDAYENTPYTFGNLAVELGVENADIMELLSADELDDLIGSDSRGNVWFIETYESKDEMLAACAVPEKPKRTAKKTTAKVVTTAPQSAKVDTTTENKSPESKESGVNTDSNTNEGTETQTPVAPKGWEVEIQDTHYVEFDANNITGHMILPETENVPAPPEGVNPNTWDLYKNGNTLPARMFWGKKVAEQIKAHAEQKEAAKAAPAPAAPVITPIDPVTGQPFPF